MTPSETMKLVTMLKATYPRPEIGADTVMAYCELLGDLEYPVALEACRRLCKTRKFLPTPAEIRELVAEASTQLSSPDEAWAEVLRMTSKVGYIRVPQFSNPAITKAVESIGWKTICASELIAVERKQFMGAYEVQRAKMVEVANVGALMLPPAVARRVHELKPASFETRVTLEARAVCMHGPRCANPAEHEAKLTAEPS